jgi:hypothetical protein
MSEQGPSTANHDSREAMYLVRNRVQSDHWTEWTGEAWHEVVHAIKEATAKQGASHPGFDVVSVLIDRHIVIRSEVVVDEDDQAVWHDEAAPLDKPREVKITHEG